ncbi:hypothetical protein D3C80_1995110 [compost metagenome]
MAQDGGGGLSRADIVVGPLERRIDQDQRPLGRLRRLQRLDITVAFMPLGGGPVGQGLGQHVLNRRMEFEPNISLAVPQRPRDQQR